VLIPLFYAGLFVCCMFCHGELARLKPEARYATSFYLMVSLGGALGAVFVALIAPHVFAGYYELQIGLGACAVLVLAVNYRDPESPFFKARWQPAWLAIVAIVVAIVVSLGTTVEQRTAGLELHLRNFYGVLRVIDEPGSLGRTSGKEAEEPNVRSASASRPPIMAATPELAWPCRPSLRADLSTWA
jgi:hypothetical protein